jgi:hypothetical protein
MREAIRLRSEVVTLDAPLNEAGCVCRLAGALQLNTFTLRSGRV